MADWAKREAQNSGLPGQHNGYGDAYRHCLWSCQMARYLNEWMAKVIGDNHEDTGERNNQDPDERKQDEANNAVGRCLGSNDKDKRDCIRRCGEKLANGRLYGLGGVPLPALF